jgi:hypothetical protein
MALEPSMSIENLLACKGFLIWALLIKLFFSSSKAMTPLVQIYMDVIIFGCSSHALVSKFSDNISREFEMNMIGEHNFFLGLQIKQT